MRIFKSIFTVTLCALIAAACAFFAVSYNSMIAQTKTELAQTTLLAANSAKLCGTEYFDSVDTAKLRFTLISPDGNVEFDNSYDVSATTDKEISLAQKNGSGFSNRKSGKGHMAYYALRLDDGSILRAAVPVKSATELVVSVLGQLIMIFAGVLIATGISAHVIAKRIVRPISKSDFSHPEILREYDEFAPVADKLIEQNRSINKKNEELKLKQSEFYAITDNMSEGMLVLNSEAEILSYNKSAVEMLGVRKMPKSIASIDVSQSFRSAVATALSGKRAVETIRSGGKYFSVIFNPVVHNSTVEGAVIVIIDETEKEQRDSLRRQFTSNISHELKTPLTSISGFAEIIMSGLADGNEAHFAENIYKEAQRLIILVGDIIKLNRLDGGEFAFDPEPIDLSEICRTVVSRLEVIAEKAQVALSVSGESAMIRGNMRIVEEMIYNLLDNAIKYNNPGGKAELCVSRNSKTVSVICRDNGIGIPDGQKERVFERFYRVDKSRSKSSGGTGLGLSIVKHAAGCHNAVIELESSEGHGTEITLTFPKA